ncbi:helix-turn-helix domain-containing protein [Rhodomicrobium sp. Az07]|uniref:helix-turn-helix transcriptional regulator n=1 Tax=Rhodomicrobium sp. Az07 TaxID=2839034 RepID=UPI001BE627C7|nr:helix-turn-helix domain-containing protein [Rhodomicrobium sp. Az07]MBT3071899.1 helix-turn-helix domain-containing protein [Rhodomicrobium sp. Az07]
MSHSVDLDDLLTNKEAATLLGINPNTLEIWRCKGRGPAFIKLGTSPKAGVRYLRSALLAWRAKQSFTSTSAYTATLRQPISKPSDARPMKKRAVSA